MIYGTVVDMLKVNCLLEDRPFAEEPMTTRESSKVQKRVLG